jgi:hypothetical protein
MCRAPHYMMSMYHMCSHAFLPIPAILMLTPRMHALMHPPIVVPCHMLRVTCYTLHCCCCCSCPGGGLVFWHPAGAMVRHVIEGFWKDLHLARGYQLVYSPHIAKLDLWKTSGHYEYYAENMYQRMAVEQEEYQVCGQQGWWCCRRQRGSGAVGSA